MDDGLEGGTNQSQEPPPLFSTIGERGPQGDHGQVGQPGPQGREGAPGTPADPRQVQRNTHRVTFVFGLVVVLFFVGGLILQRQQHRLATSQATIAHNSFLIVQQRYKSCLASVVFIDQLNRTQQQLADIEQRTLTDPVGQSLVIMQARRDRIKAYRAAIIVLPANSCGPAPKEQR